MKFLRRLSKGQSSKIADIAHPRERIGIKYWKRMTNEEVRHLKELRVQVLGLHKTIQEKVSKLHD